VSVSRTKRLNAYLTGRYQLDRFQSVGGVFAAAFLRFQAALSLRLVSSDIL
jgi:hypothetical protein